MAQKKKAPDLESPEVVIIARGTVNSRVDYFCCSGVYNESTNEIITGGIGNITVSTVY